MKGVLLKKYYRLQAIRLLRLMLGTEGISYAKSAFRRPDVKAQVSQGILFIHVPKTGGTSISSVLYGDFRRSHAHYSISDLIVADSEALKGVKSLCVVRNPWDRFRSAYDFYRSPPEWCSETIKAISQEWVRPYSFREFVFFISRNRWLLEQPHFRPQSTFTNFKGKLCIDHVVRFESLEKECMDVFTQLGLPITSLPRINQSQSSGQGYRSYYDDDTRRVVGEIYRDDIETFSYEF